MFKHYQHLALALITSGFVVAAQPIPSQPMPGQPGPTPAPHNNDPYGHAPERNGRGRLPEVPKGDDNPQVPKIPELKPLPLPAPESL